MAQQHWWLADGDLVKAAESAYGCFSRYILNNDKVYSFPAGSGYDSPKLDSDLSYARFTALA